MSALRIRMHPWKTAPEQLRLVGAVDADETAVRQSVRSAERALVPTVTVLYVGLARRSASACCAARSCRWASSLRRPDAHRRPQHDAALAHERRLALGQVHHEVGVHRCEAADRRPGDSKPVVPFGRTASRTRTHSAPASSRWRPMTSRMFDVPSGVLVPTRLNGRGARRRTRARERRAQHGRPLAGAALGAIELRRARDVQRRGGSGGQLGREGPALRRAAPPARDRRRWRGLRAARPCRTEAA